MVTIFGDNFESATSVQFNGVEAPFLIVGSTQITALVPFGATNGPIRIASLAGTATTLDNFIVTGPGADHRQLFARDRCHREKRL